MLRISVVLEKDSRNLWATRNVLRKRSIMERKKILSAYNPNIPKFSLGMQNCSGEEGTTPQSPPLKAPLNLLNNISYAKRT